MKPIPGQNIDFPADVRGTVAPACHDLMRQIHAGETKRHDRHMKRALIEQVSALGVTVMFVAGKIEGVRLFMNWCEYFTGVGD